MPTLDLFEAVLKRLVALMEDRQSTIQIIRTGRSPTMRHLTRTHGVKIAWLHDCYVRNKLAMTYQLSEGSRRASSPSRSALLANGNGPATSLAWAIGLAVGA